MDRRVERRSRPLAVSLSIRLQCYDRATPTNIVSCWTIRAWSALDSPPCCPPVSHVNTDCRSPLLVSRPQILLQTLVSPFCTIFLYFLSKARLTLIVDGAQGAPRPVVVRIGPNLPGEARSFSRLLRGWLTLSRHRIRVLNKLV